MPRTKLRGMAPKSNILEFNMNKSIGILGQIMMLLVVVAIAMSVLLLFNIKTLSHMLENQHSQAQAMFKQERLNEEEMITTARDEKIDMIATIMQMTTPDLILTFDLTALEIFAKTFAQDPDVNSVTFQDENGDYMAGDRKTVGSKIITRDIELNGKKMGSIVIGVTSDQLQKRLDEVDKRITEFEKNARQDIYRLQKYQQKLIITMVGVFVVILLVSIFVVKNIIGPIGRLTYWTKNVATGNLDSLEISAPKNEIGELNTNFRQMVDILRDTAQENKKITWLATGQSGLDTRMRGDLTLEALAGNIISFIAKYVEAPMGTLFIKTDDNTLELVADFGANFVSGSVRFEIGEGLVGQAARTKEIITLSDTPDDFIIVVSGLGEAKPRNISVIPCIYNDMVVAVIEVASFTPLNEMQRTFLEKAADSIAISISMALSRSQLDNALQKAQQMAEELQSQQEELRVSNEELEEKARLLQEIS